MDDREIVAAIAAGDPAGLAGAYDEHAESLYGYCRWMVGEPEDAADGIQDAFVIAAARLGGLRDPRKLRPWLYAVARNECHRRLRGSGAGLDDATDLAGPPDDAGGGDAHRAELRRVVRAALDGLNPGEREAIELDLRHDLHGADLAAVLGVPRNHAHTLASHARSQLDRALSALLVARTGRRGCAELDLLLDGWDGRLTALPRKRVSRHIDQCEVCAGRSRGALRPAVLYGMPPLATLPPGLRGEVLWLSADSGPQAQSYRRDVMQRAGSFQPNGFPQAVRAPRRMLALSGVAAAVGVLIALAATGIVTVLALTGSHSPRPAAADRSARPPGTAGAPATADTGSAGGASPGASPASSVPSTSAAAVIGAAPPVASSSATPTKATPSPSRSATSSAPASPTPRFTLPTPTPTPTPTTTPTPTALPSLPF
jgi:RNA polymerase sigma factor (sigma-70 family)